jgi:sterol desaturase/sphingolipid hydroxylase (fatty acid hydroxylase superfamily)
MDLLSSAWCVLLGLASSKLFPEIQLFHLFLGTSCTVATGALNYYITHLATDKFKLEYIQPKKRGTNNTDPVLYKVYVSSNILITLFFAAWPWAVLPTMPNIKWGLKELTFSNTIISYIATMIAYDFVYYFCHLALHIDKNLYKYIHKIHHQLSAPGNMLDNLYVHPIESFFLLWLQVVPLYFIPMHILSVCMYFFSIFAVTSMFHIGIKFPSYLPLMNPKFHDDHHRLSNVNYSFFTEIPDMFFLTGDYKGEPKGLTDDYKGLWEPEPKGLTKMSRNDLLKKVNSIRKQWEKYTGISQQLDLFIIKDWKDKELRDTIKFYSSQETKKTARQWIEKRKKKDKCSIVSKFKQFFQYYIYS